MHRKRTAAETSSGDMELKPPALPPRHAPPPRVPPRLPKKNVGPAAAVARPPSRSVFPRTVFEEVELVPGDPATVSGRVLDRDRETIHNWLRQILFHEYTDHFVVAGYDMPSIARMTPSDLLAIGIRQPAHRRHLKQHIDALVLPDALPRHVPASIERWLRFLRLDEYLPALLAQGFHTVPEVTVLEWEDLEELGIVRLGHQKRFLLATERIKKIMRGKLGGRVVREVTADPQPIEIVTITWRSVASVTRPLPPLAGPQSACTTFRRAPPPPPPPKGSFALLANMAASDDAAAGPPKTSPKPQLPPAAPKAANDGVQGAVALPTRVPAIEEIHSTCVLDNVERMIQILIEELDAMYEEEMFV